MAGVKELSELYELILMSPGFDSNVKLDSRISCRTALFVVIALEYGMNSADAGNPLKKLLSETDLGVLKGLVEEILQRARLQDFYGKLKRVS